MKINKIVTFTILRLLQYIYWSNLKIVNVTNIFPIK